MVNYIMIVELIILNQMNDFDFCWLHYLLLSENCFLNCNILFSHVKVAIKKIVAVNLPNVCSTA